MGWSTDIDWTSPDTIRNAPMRVIYDIFQAWNERRRAVGSYDIQADKKTAINGVVDIMSLDNYLRYMIVYGGSYANYVNIGTSTIEDYEGEDSLPAAWTIETLEDDIGVSAPTILNRYPPSYSYNELVTAEWVWWWYQALNRCTVIKRLFPDGNAYSKDGYEPGWEACKAEFLSAGWENIGYTFARHYAGNSGSYYAAYRSKMCVASGGNESSYFAPASFYLGKYTIVGYKKFEKWGQVYENPEWPYAVENKLTIVMSNMTPITNIGYYPVDLSFGAIDEVTVSQPLSNSSNGYISVGGSGGILLDCAVTGGFEFVSP